MYNTFDHLQKSQMQGTGDKRSLNAFKLRLDSMEHKIRQCDLRLNDTKAWKKLLDELKEKTDKLEKKTTILEQDSGNFMREYAKKSSVTSLNGRVNSIYNY